MYISMWVASLETLTETSLKRPETMSVLQVSKPLETSVAPQPARRPWWRLVVLGTLLLASLALYIVLIDVAPANDSLIPPFLRVWMLCFLPYAAACVLILATRPSKGRWLWAELGLIFAGALIFRAMLLPVPPGLSHDSWRYVWDARVFLNGYSPYVMAPGNPVLAHLRDFIFANSRFRNVPSIYPPGAQYIYILSYLIVPSSLFFLKGVFMVFDMTTCVVLAILLQRRGLDPRRVVLYAWCPLPIVEFAIQGHVDVITITFTALAVLAAESTSRRGRVLTGFLIGMGALTKIYPILMLAAVLRLRNWRRDWLLLATCLATIVLGYLPFYIQGNGQIFGYFGTYASEQGQNAGVTQILVGWFGQAHKFSLPVIVSQEHLVAFILVGGVSLLIFLLRQSERISMEAATLILFSVVLSVSSHVFPWYTTTLLSWIVLLMPPLRMRKATLAHTLAVLSLMYFVCTSQTGYFITDLSHFMPYYAGIYAPMMIGLMLAGIAGVVHLVLSWKGSILAKQTARPPH